MKARFGEFLCSAALVLVLSGCGAAAVSPAESLPSISSAPAPDVVSSSGTASSEEISTMKMNITVNGRNFTATLEDNAAVDELLEMLKNGELTLSLNDYSGFEKVGSLGTDLPTRNQQTTTQAGDIVLYNGNQIVMFYGSNAWSYTRLAHVDDLTGWADALGSGDVIVTLSLS